MKKIKTFIVTSLLVILIIPCALLFTACGNQTYEINTFYRYYSNTPSSPEKWELSETLDEGAIYKYIGEGTTYNKLIIKNNSEADILLKTSVDNEQRGYSYEISYSCDYILYQDLYIFSYTRNNGNSEITKYMIGEIKDGELSLTNLSVDTIDEAKASADEYKTSGKRFVVFYGINAISIS